MGYGYLCMGGGRGGQVMVAGRAMNNDSQYTHRLVVEITRQSSQCWAPCLLSVSLPGRGLGDVQAQLLNHSHSTCWLTWSQPHALFITLAWTRDLSSHRLLANMAVVPAGGVSKGLKDEREISHTVGSLSYMPPNHYPGRTQIIAICMFLNEQLTLAMIWVLPR